ncbi:MAG: tetratricopeptide repeat protein [Filimonas sp.]|nr:tetratricopeptide repeat protein [Filimonas sp.]
MKKLLLSFFLGGLLTATSFAQDSADKSLYDNGKAFMRQGDYENALMVLKRAAAQDPSNLNIKRDIVFTYYLSRDYSGAIAEGKKLIDQPGADEFSFQTLGLAYKAIAEYKECEKLYKKAIKAYPNSGVLYNEFGELYAMQQKLDEAIQYWEKGIEVAPNYSTNYYNAARYYDQKGTKTIWVLLYGETFINIESLSDKTSMMKKILTDAYKSLFLSPDKLKTIAKQSNGFAQAVAETLSKQSDAAGDGVTAESLTVIRSKFIAEWFSKYATQYPYRLFDHQRQLIMDNSFDAYNEWVFVSATSPDTYTTWVESHKESNDKFMRLLRNRVFKIPTGQYYAH